jgi:hypothetical protein
VSGDDSILVTDSKLWDVTGLLLLTVTVTPEMEKFSENDFAVSERHEE